MPGVRVRFDPGHQACRPIGWLLQALAHPTLFHFRASFGDEINRLASHFSTVTIKRVAVLAADLPIGKEGIVAGLKPTRQSLVAGFEAMNRKDVGGLPVNCCTKARPLLSSTKG